MNHRQLGQSGPQVSAVGLRCTGMSGTYVPADPIPRDAAAGERYPAEQLAMMDSEKREKS